MSHGFRVPPCLEYTAEVVLLITSLGVKRKEYNTSRQAMDLLEILRCHYKVIDFNIDTGGDEFGAGLKPELDVVRRLYQSHRVRQDSDDGMISLPQVIIDGVNIGDHQALQALEDEGFLDGILRQTVCAQCRTERNGEYCYQCKTLFQDMMPKRQLKEDLLARLKHQRIGILGIEEYDESDDEDDNGEIGG